jgi:DNA-binding FrmR family transcriptional regulator
MIQEERSCQETLTQLAAARHALDEVGIRLITKSMEECLKESPDNCEEAVEKALKIFTRLYSYLK